MALHKQIDPRRIYLRKWGNQVAGIPYRKSVDSTNHNNSKGSTFRVYVQSIHTYRGYSSNRHQVSQQSLLHQTRFSIIQRLMLYIEHLKNTKFSNQVVLVEERIQADTDKDEDNISVIVVEGSR